VKIAELSEIARIKQAKNKRLHCNRKRDRYEDEVAHTLAQYLAQANAVASYANSMKRVTCDTSAS
jgi:hypothetical protein